MEHTYYQKYAIHFHKEYQNKSVENCILSKLGTRFIKHNLVMGHLEIHSPYKTEEILIGLETLLQENLIRQTNLLWNEWGYEINTDK